MKRKLPVEMNGEEKKSRVNVMMNGDSHDIQESGKQSWPAKRQCANDPSRRMRVGWSNFSWGSNVLCKLHGYEEWLNVALLGCCYMVRRIDTCICKTEY